MATPTLLTAGEAFEDLVFVGLERLPSPGEEIRTDMFHATIGGGAVITAVGTARLGITTAIASALSPAAVARLRREGVRVHNLKRAGELHAISAALSTGAERSFVTFNGVNAVLQPRLIEALAGTSATHVHLALCPSDLVAWTRLVKRLRRTGVSVSWDFGWSETLAEHPELPALMDALDFVFVNELEAPLYARVNALDDAYPPLRARASTVIVKLGSLGSRWLRAEGDVVMPAPRVDAIDTTGAGDAFNAGFLAAWLRGGQPALCLATGNAVGAASTRAAGGLDALPVTSGLPALLRPSGHGRGATRTPPRKTAPGSKSPGARHTAATAPSIQSATTPAALSRTSFAKVGRVGKAGGTAAKVDRVGSASAREGASEGGGRVRPANISQAGTARTRGVRSATAAGSAPAKPGSTGSAKAPRGASSQTGPTRSATAGRTAARKAGRAIGTKADGKGSAGSARAASAKAGPTGSGDARHTASAKAGQGVGAEVGDAASAKSVRTASPTAEGAGAAKTVGTASAKVRKTSPKRSKPSARRPRRPS